MAITGGSEAVFSLGFLKAWEAMRVVSPDTCRPFSKDRRGLILGEGGAMLVLEPLEAALARGARHLCRDCRIRNVVRRSPHHAALSGRRGAGDAIGAGGCGNVRPSRSATSTRTGRLHRPTTQPKRQLSERCSDAHADRLAVSSTKSMHGHALGAAGALEAVARR